MKTRYFTNTNFALEMFKMEHFDNIEQLFALHWKYFHLIINSVQNIDFTLKIWQMENTGNFVKISKDKY